MDAPSFSSLDTTGPLPLDVQEFSALVAGLPPLPEGAVGLAVSGGPDSMALALLARRWADAQGRTVRAFIVDHRLRPESAFEAAQVALWLTARGIDAEILCWDHGDVAGGIQEQARAARYRLLTAAARRAGCCALFLAHHRDDQAETFLLRLAKGSGVDGLSGMRPVVVPRDGVALVRPLLSVPKARLIATCHSFNQLFVCDPGNETDRYARGRLRRLAGTLAAEGLTSERIAQTAERMAMARDALDIYVRRLEADSVTRHPAGMVQIATGGLCDAPEETQIRLLTRCLCWVGGAVYPPRLGSLRALLERVETPGAQTLHGCHIIILPAQMRVTRELSAIGDDAPLAAGVTRLWDHRFFVTLAPDAQEGRLAPLGFVPALTLDKVAPGLRRAIPWGRVRAGLPALWDGDVLRAVAAPGRSGPLTLAPL